MLHKLKGMPSEGDCVFCTVTKVQFHSVFVELDEYERKHGMIHISEISPGRIRNIRDYVKEGKVIICKVLRINRQRGHIDLSLRRVNENQRRAKVEERKQQTIAENIIQSYAEHNKLTVAKFFEEISRLLTKSGGTVYDAFEEVVEEDVSLTESGVAKEIAEELEKTIRERIKPKEVVIEGDITLHSYEENGVDIVCEAFKGALVVSEKQTIKTLGAGKYRVEIHAPNYKEAEEILKETLKIVESSVAKTDTEYKFERV